MPDALPALFIAAVALKAIRSECVRAYPLEACGVLLGEDLPAGRFVRQAVAIPNIAPEHREKRFLMDPRGWLAAERFARENDLEIVGIFHSHPDHPAEPSPTDRAAAWEFYSYLIVSIVGGLAANTGSFRLVNEHFVPELLTFPT